MRTFVNWELVAPGGASKPGGFDAKDPGDPAYDWTSLDGQIRMATQKGFAPIVYVQTAPSGRRRAPRTRPAALVRAGSARSSS